MEQTRVYCLYRVSTDKQVDHSSGTPDIPAQREKCHQFCDERVGWKIKREFVEDGISGSKVSAKKRDAIIQLQEAAKNHEFDVLLVFMFDRIGRIPRETPFVVEDLVSSGVQIFSVSEGEQRFDTDTDFLLNYIRFWNAGVEVRKISERTSAGLSTLVASGHFKGGSPPYGYSLVKDRINKRGYEVHDLAVYETEAAVVKLIFRMYVYESIGSWTLATWLTDNGYRTRRGGNWTASSIRHILKNKTYIGILKCKDTYSDVIPDLIEVDRIVFDMAQKILKERATQQKRLQRNPLNIAGKVLLNGLVFCGHCQSRLILTTAGSYSKRKDGSRNKTPRIRYTCYGKKFHVTDCDGQTGYTASILDPIVDEIIKSIFFRTRKLSLETVIQESVKEHKDNFRIQVAKDQKELIKEQQNLVLLKEEIVKTIDGSSPYSPELLSELISTKEAHCRELKAEIEKYDRQAADEEKIIREKKDQYDRLIEWAKLYDTASLNMKKSIIAFLIKRIEVKRDYEIKIDFAINLEQFDLGFTL